MDREKLLLKREHFPIVLREQNGKWNATRIELPPYHPAMSDGIHFHLVPELLYDAVEETVKDLEEIATRRPETRFLLDRVRRDGDRLLVQAQIVERNGNSITIESIPIVDRCYIGRNEINPYGLGGDQGISIKPELAAQSFMIPASVELTPELMEEYGMTLGSLFFDKKKIECPYVWYRHNLENSHAIFYKNLIICLNNAVIREKYQK